MNRLILPILFLPILVISQQNTDSQQNAEKISSEENNVNKFFLNYGAVVFNGDIKQYDFGTAYQESIDFNEMRYAVNIGYKRKIKNGIVELSFSRGQMAGLKRYVGEGDDIVHNRNLIYDPYNNFDGNGEKFLNEYIEFNSAYLFPMKDLNIYFSDFSLFAKAGVGINLFTSKKTDLYSDSYIYSYGYEDDVNGKGKNNWSKATRTRVFSLGLVGEYEIYKNFNIMFESLYKTSFDDFWDATLVSDDNDSYYFFGIGIAYNVSDY